MYHQAWGLYEALRRKGINSRGGSTLTVTPSVSVPSLAIYGVLPMPG